MGCEPGAFAGFVARNRQRICVAAADSGDVSKLLVIGYKMGISRGDAACMNGLGALYYMGDLVERAYAKAAELYEMAMSHGCYRSIINLGYIWEYGRTGERDYQKAYQYYASLLRLLIPARRRTSSATCTVAASSSSATWPRPISSGVGASTCRLDAGRAKASLSCWWMPRRG